MAAITRYGHPDRCDWPQQLVASDGIILPAGAFEEDEHPYDLQSLKVPLQHRHRAWYQVLYLCWWMRLTAPDGRPYYYDVVSHTWTFARPQRWIIPVGTLEPQENHSPSPPVAETSVTEVHLRTRLVRVLRGANQLSELLPAETGVTEGDLRRRLVRVLRVVV